MGRLPKRSYGSFPAGGRVAADEAPIGQECVEGYLFVREPFSLLLLRRPPARGQIWVPVSGKVDPTDSDWESALRREVREETGFAGWRSWIPLDWHVIFEGPDGRRWRLHAYGIELDARRDPVLSSEHEAFEWVDVPEALHRLHYEDNREAVRRLVARSAGSGSEPAVPNV
jgi:8-oxo-dGTP pyrophosphatase MutT (NUDIX family)